MFSSPTTHIGVLMQEFVEEPPPTGVEALAKNIQTQPGQSHTRACMLPTSNPNAPTTSSRIFIHKHHNTTTPTPSDWTRLRLRRLNTHVWKVEREIDRYQSVYQP